ncbi:MAG: dihydroorotate dehydrogenase electron transfer subunit [Clostridia bacterium]|nr:dihydroorotate dehydrogenase electron transfer subunit [Clostridia bacterium]
MREETLQILEHREIAEKVYRLTLGGKVGALHPGTFVNLSLPGFFLRRPISVCDAEEDRLTLIYKVVGRGTESLSGMHKGELQVLLELGNGYDLSLAGDRPLLVGGGVGVPPLYMLAKRLVARGAHPTVILGFNRRSEIFLEEDFRALGCDVRVTTVDGSYGTKGFVTDAMKGLAYTFFYTCGPRPMLRAVYGAAESDGEFSFEERMGCGFGACMGCSCKTKDGYKRVCKEGPVFRKEEIVWDD